ncbi:aspartic peptidase domain-containing protein [Mycena pura]|uniref:Aspartic peptidase domain-containing protein n=1 Tax=Mycena pura TaxID=153505 RepID=A0AAD6V5B8_9AGAR|nr:aspartic peptidase domain-containing protein [Mycena pura]
MSRFSFIFISLLFLQFSSAVSVERRARHKKSYYIDSNPDNDVTNTNNNAYDVNLTVGGTLVNALIDTGSTDLWVGSGVGAFNNTGAAVELLFGDGSDFVNGTIGLADVEIAGHKIPAQGELYTLENNQNLTWALLALVGLGFDSLGRIPGALTAAGVPDAPLVGKSLLSSIFDLNPGKGRFFALSLSRLYDSLDSADASLDIATLDAKYSAVQDAPTLPLFPDDSIQWTVLTQALQVNGLSIPLSSSINGTPSGNSVILLDSGTTNILAPTEIRDAVYSAVPGAVLAKKSSIPNTQFSEDKDVWVVPCGTAIKMSTTFGGKSNRIHPLDLTDLTFVLGPDGKNHTICVGTITNGGPILSSTNGFDMIFGDSFLRNVYTVFSFGNDTVGPHVQLLSQTGKGAVKDFARVRAKMLSNAPPELAPADTIALFDGPSTSSAVGEVPSANLAAAADVEIGSSSSTDSQVAKYAPIVIGLLGANLFLLVVVALIGIVGYVRNGRQIGPNRQYAPVKVREEDMYEQKMGQYSDGPH